MSAPAAPSTEGDSKKGIRRFGTWVWNWLIFVIVLGACVFGIKACQGSSPHPVAATSTTTTAEEAQAPSAPVATRSAPVVSTTMCVLSACASGSASTTSTTSADVPEDQKVLSTPPPPETTQIPYTAPPHDSEGGELIHGHYGFGVHIISPAWPHAEIETICVDNDTLQTEVKDNASGGTNDCATWRFRSTTSKPQEMIYSWRHYH